MSALLVRQALEVALAAMSPALDTVYENTTFTPTNGTAYQRVTLLLNTPDNPEWGTFTTERGIMQVDLAYPLETGPSAAMTRAELIRATFKRRSAFTAGGLTVTVDGTPEIAPARTEEDRYVVPVRIPFFANYTA